MSSKKARGAQTGAEIHTKKVVGSRTIQTLGECTSW